MVLKAVEIIRSIRDKHYEQTKKLSINEQIEFFKRKSEELKKELKTFKQSTEDKTEQISKV